MVKSRILSQYPDLFHFFGDKKKWDLVSKFGILSKKIVSMDQVHGNKVVILENDNLTNTKETDGVITDKPIILCVQTADCLPVFMFDSNRRIVAAIHAGWRGLYKGIIKKAVTRMKELGSKPMELVVAVGPHIQVCCYDVPKERIQNGLSGNLRGNKWYLDLKKIAFTQLKSEGVQTSSIDISDICTYCNSNYWSFRRDGEKSGRMLNIIGLKG